jgi:hypothetical protein
MPQAIGVPILPNRQGVCQAPRLSTLPRFQSRLWGYAPPLPRFPQAILRFAAEYAGGGKKNRKGLLLEGAVLAALQRFGFAPLYAKSPEAWRWRRGHGPDVVLPFRKGTIELEVKNWGDYKVTPDVVREEVLSRFPGGAVRVLVISSLANWTLGALALLEEHAIIPMEIGFPVLPATIGRAVAILEVRLSRLLGISPKTRTHGRPHEPRYFLAVPPSCMFLPLPEVAGDGSVKPAGARVIGPPMLAVGGASAEAPRWPSSV